MKGTMLWFNEAKHYGFILTETDERLYVDREGFLNGTAPVGRCARLPVEFNLSERDGKRIAVNVSFVTAPDSERARRRGSTIRARS